MLTYVDRMQLAVHDRKQAAETFSDLLGAEVSKEDSVDLLNATRTVVQAGISEFELLQPSGDGLVQQHLDQWGEGLFAAGFSSPIDMDFTKRPRSSLAVEVLGFV